MMWSSLIIADEVYIYISLAIHWLTEVEKLLAGIVAMLARLV
jgi:hypothetical protein